jgi:rubrerythrin
MTMTPDLERELRNCSRPSHDMPHSIEQIRPRELALRQAIEKRHDAGTVVSREEVLEQEIRRRAGLCPQCGELVGDVHQCPFCWTFLWTGRKKPRGKKS